MTLPTPLCPVCCSQRCQHFVEIDARDYWRCLDCQATFLERSQLPARALEEREYQLHRNDIDDVGYRKYLSRLSEPLLAHLPQGLRGLDYGCGPGPALVEMLKDAGHQMTAYDPLFFDDRTALDATYDFITCSEVAEHFHRPAEEFVRLDGLLKPGGLLAVMTTFQTDDHRFAHWHYRRDVTHVVFYRESTFQRIADRHDWQCDIPCPNVVLLRKSSSSVP